MTKNFRWSVLVAGSLLVQMWGASAWGQQKVSMPTNLFAPAPGPDNWLSVESTAVGANRVPNAAVVGSYRLRPFVVMACDEDNHCGDAAAESIGGRSIDMVRHSVVADVLFSMAFLGRFSAGIAVPVYALQTGERIEEVYNRLTGVRWLQSDGNYRVWGLGDVRIHLKGQIWGNPRADGWSLAAAVVPALPVAKWTGLGKNKDGQNLLGSSFLSVTVPKVLAAFRRGPFRAMVNAGFLLRKTAEFYSARYGNAITYALGAGYRLDVKPDVFSVEFFAELFGEKDVVSDNFTDLESAPMVYDGGARFAVGDFVITAAAGGGIISGVGVPQVQGIVAVGWSPRPKKGEEESLITPWDRDGDGLDNDVDQCPDAAEDLDEFQDADGCPDDDNDGDGIEDGYDSCANVPEDKDGFRDQDGCPDIDHDEDGIKEPEDRCAENPEDFDGFQDEDGCPDPDNDADGVLDENDVCPDGKEDQDGFDDTDGCFDQDNDLDGVPDAQDRCPDDFEVLNGIDDGDGCPESQDPLVTIEEDLLVPAYPIVFRKERARWRDKEQVAATLDVIAQVFVRNTSWTLTVEVHVAKTRSSRAAQQLSEERAQTIVEYLVAQGVAADRITALPKGATEPAVDDPGSRLNDRVVFRYDTPVPSPEELAAQRGESMDFTESSDEETMDFTEDEP